MIRHQRHNKKKIELERVGYLAGQSTTAKKEKLTYGIDMIVDNKLDQYASEDFLPEKHKESESTLAKSNLSSLSSPLK